MAFLWIVTKHGFLACLCHLDEKAGFPLIVSTRRPGAVMKPTRDSRFQPRLFPNFPHRRRLPAFSRFNASTWQCPISSVFMDVLHHENLAVADQGTVDADFHS